MSKPSIESPKLQFSKTFRLKRRVAREADWDADKPADDAERWGTRKISYLAESVTEVIRSLKFHFTTALPEKVKGLAFSDTVTENSSTRVSVDRKSSS